MHMTNRASSLWKLKHFYTWFDLMQSVILNEAPDEEGEMEMLRGYRYSYFLKMMNWWHREIYYFLFSYKIYSSHLCFVSISFHHFLAKSVEIRGLFILLLYTIDAHAVLNKRLSYQC